MNESRKKIVELDINDVLPNRFQPRIKFTEDAIIELSESIKEHGVIQPIVVRPLGDKYEIIAGERRYKGTVLAGLPTIPAIVTDLNDKDSAEVALIENVQRRDLTPIEEAISYKKILDMGYLTQEQLALKLGKSQSAVANKVRLLNLCDEVQEALMEEKISERHARSILKLDKSQDQIKILDKIINERLTVRKTDEEIDKMNNEIINNESLEVPVTPVVEPIAEVDNRINENAFVTTNPGFIDVDKIQTQAEEINKTHSVLDLDALLRTEPKKEETPVVPEPSVEIPMTPIMETPIQEPTAIFATPVVENTNTMEVPGFGALDMPEIEPVKEETIAPIPDLMASPNTVEKEVLSTIPEPVIDQTVTPEFSPLTSAINETPVTSPIVENVDSYFKPEVKEASPIFEGNVPLTPIMDIKEQPIAEQAKIPEPIIITDYSKQYDPILPSSLNQAAEKVDFKQIIGLIRQLTETIEKCGYEIDAEEYDLDDTYQVIFKIEKDTKK